MYTRSAVFRLTAHSEPIFSRGRALRRNTPCRHGPPLSRPLTREVIGFALSWGSQEKGVLWISGDTVLYDGVRQVADHLQINAALLHLGGVQFPVTGPVRYTLTAKDAVELCRLIEPRIAIPIHYEGWKHFKEDRDGIEREFARAPEDIRNRIQWLPLGLEVEVADSSYAPEETCPHDDRLRGPSRVGRGESEGAPRRPFAVRAQRRKGSPWRIVPQKPRVFQPPDRAHLRAGFSNRHPVMWPRARHLRLAPRSDAPTGRTWARPKSPWASAPFHHGPKSPMTPSGNSGP
jgi:hypothetical protein